MRRKLSIRGPLLSVSNLSEMRSVFETVFDLEVVSQSVLGAEESRVRFGVERCCTGALLETPGTSVGIELIQFDPPAAGAMRVEAAGVDCHAWKVIDFMTTDFERARGRVHAAGLELHGRSDYTVPQEGRFTEAHVELGDGVVCALLAMHDTPHAEFLRVTDRLFGEVLGFSTPVADHESVAGFYRTLGLDEVYRYEFESESFGAMIGAGGTTRLIGRNFGTSKRDPMIGIVHYGLPVGSYSDLGDRSVLPNRGFAAVRLAVDDLDQLLAECADTAVEVVHRSPESALLRGPHAVLHLVEQREK